MQNAPTAGFTPETPLILGMMRLHDHPELTRSAKLADWISARVDEGLTVFDHADIYGAGDCERLFGDALRAYPALAVEQIDTFLIHRPDPLLQAGDVARVLESVRNTTVA